jgi:antitoxin (DNA-binding transcriptional repressor) of toxin-antitoxin stability system
MKTVNMHEAKTHLSRLVDLAAGGEDIVIAKNGKPVARLVRWTPAIDRQPGGLRGKIRIAADFDAPLPADIAEAFGIER